MFGVRQPVLLRGLALSFKKDYDTQKGTAPRVPGEIEIVGGLQPSGRRLVTGQFPDRRGVAKSEGEGVPAGVGEKELKGVAVKVIPNGVVQGREMILRPVPEVHDKHPLRLQTAPAFNQKGLLQQGTCQSLLVKGIDDNQVMAPGPLFVHDEVLAGGMEDPQIGVLLRQEKEIVRQIDHRFSDFNDIDGASWEGRAQEVDQRAAAEADEENRAGFGHEEQRANHRPAVVLDESIGLPESDAAQQTDSENL